MYTLCHGCKEDVFYSSGADGMVVCWSLEKEDGELMIRFPYPIYSLERLNHLLFCGGNNGNLTIFNLDTKKIEKQLQIQDSAIFDILFWNKKLLLANGNGVLTILNSAYDIEKNILVSTKSLRKLVANFESIYLTGSESKIWRFNKNFEEIKSIQADNQSIFALEYSPSKNLLLSGGRDATIKIWSDLKLIETINAHWYHVNCIAFNQSEQYFATCSLDKSIKIWQSKNTELVKVINNEKFDAHKSSVNKILWIGINRFISCSDDRMIMCFEIQQK